VWFKRWILLALHFSFIIGKSGFVAGFAEYYLLTWRGLISGFKDKN
jgi:hypothetical protein